MSGQKDGIEFLRPIKKGPAHPSEGTYTYDQYA